MKDQNKLATAPIGKLVISLALPAVVAQLVNVLYNIVDRIYIGHIEGVGSVALTGLGVCLPIITLIAAFSNLIGAGGAPLAAMEMGRGNNNKAERILGTGVFTLIVMSIILSAFFFILKKPILLMFGGSENTLPFAMDYLSIYLFGTIFVQISLALNTFIACQGFSKIAMSSILIGACINIVLDPVFIFFLDMGVRGAALATIIAQASSSIWIIHFLTSKKSILKIRKKYLKLDRELIKSIFALGISPFIMTATESLVAIVLNSGLQYYGGDVYVGTFTIMNSVMQMVTIPVGGFTNGCQPIISYNFGAENYDRIKQAFKKVFSIVVVCTFSCMIIIMIFARPIASIFTNDLELIDLVAKIMPMFLAGVGIFGVQMACQSTFIGLGQAKQSFFLACLRKLILLIPLALILPIKFGVMGIYYAEPIADISAAIVTGLMFRSYFKKNIG